VPRPQIWKLVPVDSALVANLFGGGSGDPPAGGRAAPGGGAPGGGAPAPGGGPEGRAPATGGPDGSFQALIEDEDRKVNVQFDALDSGGLQGARLEALLALVGDRRWDFLFEREDAGGQKTSRTDLAVHLKDWIDADTAQSSVTGLMDRPFEAGFGDENFAYDRGPDRYKAKNARFDSLDELFLVTGVSDALMSAFGDRLTVYLGQNSKMNVNAENPDELVRNARIMAGTAAQHPALSDPTFAARLQKAVRELSQGGFLSISPYQFAQVLDQLGLAVNPSYLQATNTDQRGGFTDRSRVFRVRGVATVGAVEKSIEAVVTFDPDQAREQAAQLGRLLHWREE
jgi:general secretion pathway protein K